MAYSLYKLRRIAHQVSKDQDMSSTYGSTLENKVKGIGLMVLAWVIGVCSFLKVSGSILSDAGYDGLI
ncbi:transmembrane protein, putative [Medicago truncatula]|uniref:Transmembrane protein, putative n=1 Tax=Medicago truncatula TaxID=3880 RepID=G7KIG3_MEDTR|nr:transmembrane protein, putative [Medicago truncatula]